MKDENKVKHLEMIQGAIGRMGGNLFYLRGWSITLIVGVLAILSQKDNVDIFPGIVLVVVVLMFWVYDGYFLSLEKKYRALYDKVRKSKNGDTDFSMDISEFNTHADKTIFYCMLSKTIAPFYVVSLAGAVYLLVRGVL